ncbi:hypothetical protein BCR44DRAFT_1051097 [Catenaria anguillulae PL171]|uniref:Uncharacterized protein n=1 Tax=Catenaria anguillulae PL171 TaxID=765915 RepID=A0A1Y2HR08_9FUNG|nr:hypothetical protein BCR44DRAFT_1051097 [Catenaria anguillulae PL171]
MSNPSSSPIRIAPLNAPTASTTPTSISSASASASATPAGVGLRRKDSFPTESNDDLGSTATMTHGGFMAAMRLRDDDQSTVSGPKSLGSMMHFESEEYVGPANTLPQPRPLQPIQSVLAEDNASHDREGGLGRGLVVQDDSPMPMTLGRPLKPSAKIGPLGSGPLLQQSASDTAAAHDDHHLHKQDSPLDSTSPTHQTDQLATSSNAVIHPDPTSVLQASSNPLTTPCLPTTRLGLALLRSKLSTTDPSWLSTPTPRPSSRARSHPFTPQTLQPSRPTPHRTQTLINQQLPTQPSQSLLDHMGQLAPVAMRFIPNPSLARPSTILRRPWLDPWRPG